MGAKLKKAQRMAKPLINLEERVVLNLDPKWLRVKKAKRQRAYGKNS